MKIIFLGTGTSQGVPVIACKCPVCTSLDYRNKRLRTSVYVETENLSIVIDTGPDFRQQMLNARIHKLDAVLFTHAHKDHIAGLDDVRAFNFHQKKIIPLYGETKVLDQIKKEFAYIFSEDKYPGIPQVQLNTIVNKPFSIDGQKIYPIKLLHYQLSVFGFRINDFSYVTDASFITEEEKKKLIGSKVLVINALQKKKHISHFTLEQALDLVRELSPHQAYLTHISHRMGLHQEVTLDLPKNVQMAYDGLEIFVGD